MPSLRIEIVRFTDNWQPGFVECRFADVSGHVYTFEEKVPIVSSEYLDEKSAYPLPGMIGCKVISRSDGLVHIEVEPLSESIECDVLACEVMDDENIT